MSGRSQALVAAVVVQILFGVWPVAGAAAMGEVPPFAVVGFRLFVGAPLMFVLVHLVRRPWPKGKDWLMLFLMGASGIAANQLLFIEGLFRAGPINATIFAVAIPASTLAVALILRRETATPRKILGVVVTVLGVLVLVRAERLDLSDDKVIGCLFFVANTTCYSIYLVLGKPVFERLGALTAVAWIFVFGAVCALPFTLQPSLQLSWTELSGPTWGALIYILIGATIGTYFLNAIALKHLDSSIVAIFVTLQPLVGVAAAVVMLNEYPTPRTLVSGVVILLGTLLASIAPRPQQRSASVT